MRKLLFIGVVFAVLQGCQSGKIELQKEKYQDNTEMWEISVDKSLFSSSNTEYAKACDVVNQKLAFLTDSLVRNFKRQVVEYKETVDSIPNGQALLPLAMLVEDSVFMATTDYISLRVKVYASLGGANGETTFYSINYDLNGRRFLLNGDVLDLSQTRAIDQLLKGAFKNPEHCFSEDPMLATCSALNLTDKSVCFTYAKYILGPGACGDVTVDVERSKLKDLLLIK